MKIPDETHYRKGERRIEDTPGYVLCTQCDKCPMNDELTITPDGRWFCFYFQKWRDGNDILEYKCRGYQVRSCKTCGRRKYCPEAGTTTYCKRYFHKGMKKKGRAYVGRRYALRTHDPKIIANEEEFVRKRYEEINEL